MRLVFRLVLSDSDSPFYNITPVSDIPPGHPHTLLEHPAEILRILEFQFVGYLVHGLLRIEKTALLLFL